MSHIKAFGSKGTEQRDISDYFSAEDINFVGEVRSGAIIETNFHVLYDGDGDYYLVFDNFFEKIEIKIPVKK